MIKSEVMDIVGVCQSFPDIPDHVLDRPHILDSIDDILVGDTKLVVLEGAGMGKTTLLAQFALRHQRHVAALFVRPTSRWGYDPAMLRFDLANQLQWHLHGNELHSVQDADDALLGQLLMELGRRSRRAGRTFYFVVDGIDDIIQTGSSVHQLVLEMLPWSFPGLRFVLSGATERLASELPKGITPKSFPLPHFTLDETIRFMDGLGVERRTIEELHRTCRGVPEHLAALRRLIHSGTSPHALLQNLSGTLPRLFEMEWTSANTDELKTARIVALLAYDRKQHTVADVARILKIPETDVRHSIQPASFITIDSDTHTVTFVSEAFRSFASQRLEHLRREITRLCIDDLITEPESAAALAYLPAYLEQAERFDDLLQYLSPDHFTLMLERSQSLVPVQEKAALGVRTARRLHRDSDLVRFSMQHSALNQLARAETWRSEITARMALQDYESALRLAQNAVTKEDRLQLLAVVAKTKRQNNQSIESELHDQIRHLYAQLDHGGLGERGVDIASDLIYVEPELAIDLVERASNTGSSENALDWAFATLSFRTLGSPGDDVPGTEQTADVIARIKDPGVRRFASHATLLISDHSAEQVIVEVEAIEKPEDRLYLTNGASSL